MAKVFRCTSCGAAVKYNIQSDGMQCPFCGTHIPIFKIRELEAEKEENAREYNKMIKDMRELKKEITLDNKDILGNNVASAMDDFDIENDPLNNTGVENFSYSEKFLEIDEPEYMDCERIRCNSCGAELMTGKDTIATKCAYCNSPNIIADRLSDGLKPKKIIPFRITKERAKDIFREWVGNNQYAPNSFKKETTLDDIQGIYVPFWLYDYEVHADVFVHGVESNLLEGVSAIRETRNEEQTPISRHKYMENKQINVTYANVPADASKRMPDKFMDNIEPYDYNWLRDFEMPYLSGFYAEKLNFTYKDIEYRAKRKLRTFMDDTYKNMFYRYDKVEKKGENIRVTALDRTYALLPVWYLNYKYEGKDYIYVINGQSGKYAGDLPLSMFKVASAYFLASIIFVLIYIVAIAGTFFGFAQSLIFGIALIPGHIAALKYIKKTVDECKQSYNVYGEEYVKPQSYSESKGIKKRLS